MLSVPISLFCEAYSVKSQSQRDTWPQKGCILSALSMVCYVIPALRKDFFPLQLATSDVNMCI